MTTTITHPDALDDEVQPADVSCAIAELDDPALPCEGAELPGYDPTPITTHSCLCDEES
jgi:hypothetical protein